MADEINVKLRIVLKNGDFTVDRDIIRAQSDQTGKGAQSGLQKVGTSWEVVDLGNVVTEGYAYFRNLNDTNFVQIGPTGVPIIKLLPGQLCLFPVDPTVTLYAKADTAECNVDVFILEA